jgi:hypothetical protein
MIPDNFVHIKWQDTYIGQVVYIDSEFKGRHYVCGQDGKYKVVDKDKRLLRNGNSKFTFNIPNEDLLIKF